MKNKMDTKEIQEIKKVMKSRNDKRLYQRYITILNHLRGEDNRAISNILGLCEHTIGKYIKIYKEKGIKGLKLSHSPGTPKKLSDEQEKELVETIIEKTPDQVGYPNKKNWRVSIIRNYIKDKFNVEYSDSGARDLLHRLNLSYTRPTYTLAKADIEKQNEFKQEFELLKKIC